MHYSQPGIDITRMTRGKLPDVPFVRIKNLVMGKHYELSLVFPGEIRAKALHKKLKNKDTLPNVLSIPLSETEGEIFISLKKARSECKAFGYTYEKYIGFLFIHALFHLKGLTHGSTMERKEKEIRARFNI